MSIPPPSDPVIRVAGYSYPILLAASLVWYGNRRSRLARYLLASLIFLPAIVCLCIGLSMVHAGANTHHTPDAVSDPGGLATVIGLGMCVVGAVIAFLGVQVLARPFKRSKDNKTG